MFLLIPAFFPALFYYSLLWFGGRMGLYRLKKTWHLLLSILWVVNLLMAEAARDFVMYMQRKIEKL